MKLKRGTHDGLVQLFYGCSNYPSCASSVGAHPDGRPMGVPGDAPTKAARTAVHQQFDKLWIFHYHQQAARRLAYAALQEVLGLSKDECHIGRFNIAFCEVALEAIASGEVARMMETISPEIAGDRPHR